jgi:hypothetical protein
MSSKEVTFSNNPQSINQNSFPKPLREGEFFLTYSQIFTLNKRIPKGWKIELFDNMTKFDSSMKQQAQIKRPRSSNIIKDYSDEDDESYKRKKPKKADHDYVSKEDSISSNNNSSFKNQKRIREKMPQEFIKEVPEIKEPEKKPVASPLLPNPNAEVWKKCEKVFNRLKKHALCETFFGNLSEQFSLSVVEKRIKTNFYQSTYQFMMDVRGVWNHHFSRSIIGSELYQKSYTLSNFFEEIVKDLDNPSAVVEEKPETKEVKPNNIVKPVKALERFGIINKPVVTVEPVRRERSNSTSDKPMSGSEKNLLRSKIMKLTNDQLRGIIKIVSGATTIEQNSKYVEFELDKLPHKKLRELEKYVKNCIKAQKELKEQNAAHNNSSSNHINGVNRPTNISNISNSSTAQADTNKTNHNTVNSNASSTLSSTQPTHKPVSSNQKPLTLTHIISSSSTNANNVTALKRPSKKPVEEDEVPKFQSPKDGSPVIEKNCDIVMEKVNKRTEFTPKPVVIETIPQVIKETPKEIKEKELIKEIKEASLSTSDSNLQNLSENKENKTKTLEQIQEETKDSNKKDILSESSKDDDDSDSGKISYLNRFRQSFLP